MPAALMALAVFAVVAAAAFAFFSLIDQRRERARLIKDRLAAERQPTERSAEDELAVVRDEQMSDIPVLDAFLRRSERAGALQKLLLQAGMGMRTGNFLGMSLLAGIGAAAVVFVLSRRADAAWVALLAGLILPYSYAA